MTLLLQYLVSGVAVGAFYALVALSMQVTFSASRVLNFAQGELVVTGGFLMYTFTHDWHVNPWLALPLTVVGGALVGAVFELVVIHGLRAYAFAVGTLATVAAGAALRGLYMIWFGVDARAVQPLSRHKPIHFGHVLLTFSNLIMIVATVLALALLFGLSARSWIGRAMRAASSNPEGALVVGIKPSVVRLVAFGLSGAISAFAGGLIVPTVGVAYDAGLTFVLAGFTGALLGGLASPLGAVAGGLALGIVTSVADGEFGSRYEAVWILLVLVLVLYLRPSGLLGGGGGAAMAGGGLGGRFALPRPFGGGRRA